MSEDDDETEKLKIQKLNRQAMDQLLLCMDTTKTTGKIAFRIIKGCKGGEYKHGLASLAWSRLKTKFEPRGSTSLLKLKREFNQLRMKKDEDPEEWITKLEEIQERINDMETKITISDDEVISQIITNLPKEYKLEQKFLEKQLDDEEDLLTIEEIRDEKRLKYIKLKLKMRMKNQAITRKMTGQ